MHLWNRRLLSEHTGADLRPSRHRLLTTLAASGDGPRIALEGSVFVAGAAVQWLRDGLRLFDEAPAVEALARRSDPDQPVLFVPGFVGLGRRTGCRRRAACCSA